MTDSLAGAQQANVERVQYGMDSVQFADVRFPTGKGPFPLLLGIHGGWWLSANNLDHFAPLCARLASLGIVTCNLECRLIGDPGGGWPGTFLDVARAVEFFKHRLARDRRVDIKRAAVIGHSSGGHLALWLGARHRVPKGSVLYTGQEQWLTAVISLAGIPDLKSAWEEGLGDHAVDKLIGGSPVQYPKRYLGASPLGLLPTGLTQVLIHGQDDDRVPISQSRRFAEKAEAVGDEAKLVALDGAGHFELIDPESRARDAVARLVLEALKA